MSTISEFESDSPQSLQQPSDYNTSPPDPEPEADEQILEALRSPKDRLFVLRLGESMESLIQDRHNRTKIELIPSSSYHKLLVHRCAVYYRLTPVTEAGNKSLTLVVIPESRIPLRRIADLVPADDSPYRPFQIMRRATQTPRSKASSQTGSGNDESAIGTGDVSDGDPSEAGSTRGIRKKTLTLSERQAQYEEARSRIFKDLEEKEKGKSQDMSASSSTLSLLSVDSSSVGAASGGGSSSVGESPDDSGSVDRDHDWDSSPRDKNDCSSRHATSAVLGNAKDSRPNNLTFNGTGQSPGYYSTLYDPYAPSASNPSQTPNNPPHYQSPVYQVYQYGPPPFVPPYAYFPYPPPPPTNDPSGGSHATNNPMGSLPTASPNETGTPSSSDMYSMPPVSYVNPYMWSQPHAPPNPHAGPQPPPPQAAPNPHEYGQISYHHPPPHPHTMHPYAYGGPLPPYVSPLHPHPHPQSSPQSPHPPPVQSQLHVPQMQTPSHPQTHPPMHTYQPQPQHPSQALHQPPHPVHLPSSSSQMTSLSMRPHSLGTKPSCHTESHPYPYERNKFTTTSRRIRTFHATPPSSHVDASARWNVHLSSSPSSPSNNYIPPRRPSGKFLYDPAAEVESSPNHLGPRFPFRRNGGRPGPTPHQTTSQGMMVFPGELTAANKKKNVYNPNISSSNASSPSQSMSASTSSTSSTSTTSQSSANNSLKQSSGATAISKHPLPARPDWAVGLKAQPTLHHPQNYPAISSQRSNHNRFAGPPGPSDVLSQVALPALQSTDFPPLPLNTSNNSMSEGNTNSNTIHRPVPGGAWAAPPGTRASSGSTANVSTTTGILKGPTVLNTNGSMMLFSSSQTHTSPQEQNGVASRLDEPDRAFERPGPKAGGELFNPNGSIPKGVANNVIKNTTKGKPSTNGTGPGPGKNKGLGGGSTFFPDPSEPTNFSVDARMNDMVASAILVDSMAGLRFSGKDEPIDSTVVVSGS
ncbi:hypothetical protein Clacol_005637 [Clathrus columnatus]|uniref:SUZ domain-containing protein n=1 Tax=Clathrus columnatus TaxID=1419009 RepID=A0AAV5ADY6_9AGAM|nr:hypothetical protein Clacol_005637 [Clathrus columnatus]